MAVQQREHVGRLMGSLLLLLLLVLLRPRLGPGGPLHNKKLLSSFSHKWLLTVELLKSKWSWFNELSFHLYIDFFLFNSNVTAFDI